MEYRKAFLVRLPNGIVNLIPLEEIRDYKIITPDEKTDFRVYTRTIRGGASNGLGDYIMTRDLTDKDVDTILGNCGECFVEVDYRNELSVPTNAFGDKLVVLHLTLPVDTSAAIPVVA